MEIFLVFIWNAVIFILNMVLRLALYSAKLTLSLIKVPIGFTTAKALGMIRSKDVSGGLRLSTLSAYISLKSLIALLNLLIIITDILLFILTFFGSILGFVVTLLILVVILAGAYIIILNDCSVSASSSPATHNSPAKDKATAGSSETAGMGSLTEEAKNWAKDWSVTYIGDSLGKGSESNFKSAFPNAVYDSDPSRGLISIKGQSTGETAIETLRRLVKENKVKENLVVAIGTNNDMSTDALQKFYDEIPSSVKTITWVLTASEGGVDNSSINSTIKNFVNSHDNMRYLDWKTYVDRNGGWSSYQGGDNIHMSADGYSKYVNFQTQGLYDLYGKGSSSSTQSASSSKFYLDSLYQLASDKVSTAINLHVQAEEKNKKDSSKDGVKEKEGSNEKEEKKKGCHYTTKRVSSSSNKKSAGGVLEPDGTGTHTQNVPQGFGLIWKPQDLPEELKKYAIDPESLGIKYGAPVHIKTDAPDENGWCTFNGGSDAGQCTELVASLNYALWEKDGGHFHNVQGHGRIVAGIISGKTGAPVTHEPRTGAVFSTSYSNEFGHTGVVSHVFENGDVLIVEQNISKYSGASNGTPNTWDYRLISKASYGSEFDGGFIYLGDAGYKMSANVKTLGN
jgi:lysophospholipase L1-like esterase